MEGGVSATPKRTETAGCSDPAAGAGRPASVPADRFPDLTVVAVVAADLDLGPDLGHGPGEILCGNVTHHTHDILSPGSSLCLGESPSGIPADHIQCIVLYLVVVFPLFYPLSLGNIVSPPSSLTDKTF